MAPLHTHSVRVLFLRRFFPVLAVLLLVLIVAWPAVNEFRINRKSRESQTRLKVEAIAMAMPKDGGNMQLQISRPEYTGQDDAGHPYVVSAERVIQDGLRPGDSIMNLESPSASMVMNDTTDEAVGVKAKTGVYDPERKHLQLDGNVVITHTEGYELHADSLTVELSEGRSISETPVSGSGPNGALSGEKLELLDKGNHIILHGKSKVTLIPDQAG